MAGSIKFRSFESSDLQEQRRLFFACFPETQGNPLFGDSYHRWKFTESPAPSRQYIAEEEGELLGYYAALPMEYKVGASRGKAGLVVDVMVHPSRQGKGIFSRMGAFSCDSLKAEGFDFTTGYPIRPQVIPGHLKVGWKVAFELPMYLAVLSPRSLLASRGLGWLAPLAAPFAFLQSLAADASLALRGARRPFETVDSSALTGDAAFWDFQARWLERQKVAWVRAPQAWAWRTRRPGARYVSVLLKDAEGRVQAHAAASPTELQGVSTLAVLDFQVIEPSLAPALHRALRELARRTGRETLSFMGTRTFARRHGFGLAGWLRSPAVFKLIINNLSKRFQDEDLLQEGGWHVTWIDSDDI